MKRLIRISFKSMVMVMLALALGLGVMPASPAFALESLAVDIGRTATLVDEGQAVEVKIKVRCAVENFEVLEAFVYVVQDGNQSDFAPIPVICSDRPNMQVSVVRVPAFEFLFHEGEANSSAFILLVDPATQDTLSTGDTGPIHIR